MMDRGVYRNILGIELNPFLYSRRGGVRNKTSHRNYTHLFVMGLSPVYSPDNGIQQCSAAGYVNTKLKNK